MARDSVARKEEELIEEVHKLSDKLKNFVDENIDDMVRERKQMVTRMDKEFLDIKLVCSTYFEKYDGSLQEMVVNQDLIQKKYESWSKVLIEPASLNDARLYAVETRLQKEEEIRISEYQYVREMLKKLVYSMEQDVKALGNGSQIEPE